MDLNQSVKDAQATRAAALTDVEFLADARGRVSDLLSKTSAHYRELRLKILKALIGSGEDSKNVRQEMTAAGAEHALLRDALTLIDQFEMPSAQCVLAQAEIDLTERERDLLEFEAKQQIEKMRTAASAIAEANPGVILDTKASAAAAKLQRVVDMGRDLDGRRTDLSNRRALNDQEQSRLLAAGFLQVR